MCASTSDNMEAWKWKLTTLLHNKDKQEVVSRDKKDRRDFEQIAALASKMGLYSHLYIKVVVVSKEPLPNYRFDLDEKRPQREVILPLGLHMRVDCYLGDYLSQKSGRTEGFQDNAFSRSNSCCSIATDDGIFEQPEPLPQSKAAMEKIFWRSVQMRSQQQAWQVHTTLKHMECILFDYHLNAIVTFAYVCEHIFVSCFHNWPVIRVY
ncbi:DExH-box ATP-dependent RNA helicase DExH3-like isoform X2 [Actinidia eriantha]|nr:DExH-box ATP-dependent RNA helicase DExH3-like isoform X2 [Actinidia eriantha]